MNKNILKKTCPECDGKGITFSITPSIHIECDLCHGEGSVLANPIELLINVNKPKEQPDDI